VRISRAGKSRYSFQNAAKNKCSKLVKLYIATNAVNRCCHSNALLRSLQEYEAEGLRPLEHAAQPYPSATVMHSELWLWNMYGLANHHTSVQHEHGGDRMELKGRSRQHCAERYSIQNPVLAHPICHQSNYAKGSWDWGALKVL
jgi:hypothetical protein